MFVSSQISNADAGEISGGSGVREEHRPLTVLQIVPRMESGAVERGTLDITEAITREGGRALIATSGGEMLPRATKAGAEVIAMNVDTRNPLNLWQNARLLARLIKDLGIDVVHARARAPAWSAYWATRRTGTPFITSFENGHDRPERLKRRFSAVMAKGSPVIVASEFMRNRIILRYGLPRERVVVIPRGVDVNVFSEDAVGNERAVTLADQWGLLDDPRPVIMLPARRTRLEAAEDLIGAAERLRAMRGDDFLILLVGETGSGKPDEALRKAIDLQAGFGGGLGGDPARGLRPRGHRGPVHGPPGDRRRPWRHPRGGRPWLDRLALPAGRRGAADHRAEQGAEPGSLAAGPYGHGGAGADPCPLHGGRDATRDPGRLRTGGRAHLRETGVNRLSGGPGPA
jgi:hypothetical protein